MGKSNSIQEQQKSNKEFQQYVDEMDRNMCERQKILKQEIDQLEKRHYENFSDKALLIEGEYHHLTTVSEWSLKSVSVMIDACSRAIFGSKESAPEGSKKGDTKEEISQAILANKEREQYIANEAFRVVQAIVGDFNSITSTSIEKQVTGKPIAPGMTLFIGVENNSYSVKSFFSEEKIIQIIFVFKVCYSIKEGQQQSQLSDLEMYEDQLMTFRKIIKEFYEEEGKLDIHDKDYFKKFNILESSIKELEEKRQRIKAELIKLGSDRLEDNNEDDEVCAYIAQQMHLKRIGLNCARTGHSRTSDGFTYTDGIDGIYSLVRSQIPRNVYLVSVKRTDYVGNHFQAIFSSENPISMAQANSWVEAALSGRGNFRFDL